MSGVSKYVRCRWPALMFFGFFALWQFSLWAFGDLTVGVPQVKSQLQPLPLPVVPEVLSPSPPPTQNVAHVRPPEPLPLLQPKPLAVEMPLQRPKSVAFEELLRPPKLPLLEDTATQSKPAPSLLTEVGHDASSEGEHRQDQQRANPQTSAGTAPVSQSEQHQGPVEEDQHLHSVQPDEQVLLMPICMPPQIPHCAAAQSVRTLRVYTPCTVPLCTVSLVPPCAQGTALSNYDSPPFCRQGLFVRCLAPPWQNMRVNRRGACGAVLESAQTRRTPVILQIVKGAVPRVTTIGRVWLICFGQECKKTCL